MITHKILGFTETLTEEDYGIIISNGGRLKGIWMPVDRSESPIPDSIVQLCLINFGIDPNTDEHVSQTIH
jgi:hypothetical protein